MLPIPQIVEALTATRGAFGTAFLQAQASVSVPIEARKEFEAVALGRADDAAFTAALKYAQAQGFLDALLTILVRDGLEKGTLFQALVADAQARSGDAELQAITNPARGFRQPDIVRRGYASGTRWTGKILVDSAVKGTGILIGPHLVLTAWHVVQSLFEPDANLQWVPKADAHTHLQVEFDDFLARIGQGQALGPSSTVIVNAHQDWCVAYSSCTDDELVDTLPAQLAELDGFWDYAIIRLAGAPGRLRRWAALDARSVVPAADEGIVLFQHPGAQHLLVDESVIAASNKRTRTAVPKLRFLHYANTLHGSSGGPCFDKSFTLFGLHQGAWSGHAKNGRAINRGVPIVRVLEHVNTQIKNLPPLDPSEDPVWAFDQTEARTPVIGTRDFQALVWQSVTPGGPRLLAIKGEKDKEKGRGKTFCARLLSAMLPDGGHLKLTLTAEAISKMDALQLVARICEEARAAAPAVPPLAEAHTTATTWINDHVLPALVRALDEVRQGRHVWLMITDLNKFNIQDEHGSQLLQAIYQQLARTDWLRVVLDGMQGDLQASLAPFSKWHDVPDEVSRDDVVSYFDQLTAKVLDSDVVSPAFARMVNAGVNLVWPKYQTARQQNPDTAMEVLAREADQVTRAYVT